MVNRFNRKSSLLARDYDDVIRPLHLYSRYYWVCYMVIFLVNYIRNKLLWFSIRPQLVTTEKIFRPTLRTIMACFAFVASVMWIMKVADILVGLLKVCIKYFQENFLYFFLLKHLISPHQTVGIVFSISEALLGMTVLAWGNSLGGMGVIFNQFSFE